MSIDPFLAIPSPDLVVNLFASGGQVLGLLAATAGGVAWTRRGRDGAPASRWPLRIAVLLFLATAGSFVLYHFRVVDAERARLAANLTRPSIEAGQAVGDTNLWTLGFSDQAEHPLALATDDLARLLESSTPPALFDVRESEEAELGRIEGAVHCRYPDLLADRSPIEERLASGSAPVLICFSGNRSSELATKFERDGLGCRFVVGGYEKWIAEDRALRLEGASRPDALRAIPRYPGDDVLLTTKEVHELRATRNALFVDVRYPADFERGHLPGAHNLPMRKLGTAALEAALGAVPDRPIILPAYDKRSSFYASLVGLRLSRAHREVLGRYTLPHEYFEAKGPRAHVAAWEATRAEKTPLGFVQGRFVDALGWLEGRLGSLLAAVVVAVALLRGALLRWTLRSDVDSWLSRFAAAEARRKTDDLGLDARRSTRIRGELVAAAGVRPLQNLAVSIVQIVLFLALFAAVDRAAEESRETFLGLALGARDGTGAVPLVVALLTSTLVLLGGRVTRGRIVVAILAGALLAGLAWNLSVAVGLYLVVSLAWVAVQAVVAQRIARGRAGLRAERRPTSPATAAIVPLERAAGRSDVGGKGEQLGRLASAGLPVPAGFVLTTHAFDGDALRSGVERSIRRALRRHGGGAERFAVRSSGLSEDGAEHSYAGVFDTRLDVAKVDVAQAVKEIRASYHGARLAVYAEAGQAHDGGVVVQAMVPAEFAGVLFTEHPGHAARTLVEYVAGLGEALVSGHATPERAEFGRLTGRLLSANAEEGPALDLAPLIELGRVIEARHGRPQDIEWAFADGRFHLLQTRDITAPGDSGNAALDDVRRLVQQARHADDACLEPDELLFEQDELAELLPEPSHYSAWLMGELWAPGGAVDLACEDLGVPYAVRELGRPLVVDALGQLLVDTRESAARQRSSTLSTGWRIGRIAAELERETREEFIPECERRARLLAAVDLAQLGDAELLELHDEAVERFNRETYRAAERVNVAAALSVQTAVARLEKRGLDPAPLLAEGTTTPLTEAIAHLSAGDDARFLADFGHRAPHDFELSTPRYREAPLAVRALASTPPPKRRTPNAGADLRRVERLLLERARAMQDLKERAKHAAVRELEFLRRILLELASRIDPAVNAELDFVFDLERDEIAQALRGSSEGPLALARRRRAAREIGSSLALPARWTAARLEAPFGESHVIVPHEGALQGERVAGVGAPIGPARVLISSADIDELQPGEILVARFTDPLWTPAFTRAAGIVTEVGGWLSHGAILARELDLPAIVAVENATRVLSTGEFVRLEPCGRVEVLTNGQRSAAIEALGLTAEPSHIRD